MKKLMLLKLLILALFISDSANAKSVYDLKNWYLGTRLALAQNNLEVVSPYDNSNSSTINMVGYSLGADFGYEFFEDVADGFINYTFTNSSGDGSFDGFPNGGTNFALQNADNKINNFAIGLNLDAYSEIFWKFSPRIGYFQKYISSETSGGASYDSISGVLDVDGVVQKTNSKYHGGTVGFKIENSSDEAINSLIFDYYPLVQYTARQNFLQSSDPQDMHRRYYSQNGNGSLRRNYGFSIQLQRLFKAGDHWIKLYTSYDRIVIKRLRAVSDEYDSSWSRNNALSKGSSTFDQFDIGIGFIF